MFPSNGNVVTKHHRTDKHEGGGGGVKRDLERVELWTVRVFIKCKCR